MSKLSIMRTRERMAVMSPAVLSIESDPKGLYSSILRDVIDGWMDCPQLRYAGFFGRLESIEGWLQTYPLHLTGLDEPIGIDDAKSIIAAYYEDELAQNNFMLY